MSDDSSKPGGNTGRANLKPAWKKGDPSPNPSGRPKSAKWRRKNLNASFLLLQSIVKRRNDPETTVTELVAAAKAAASNAGLLTVTELVDLLKSPGVGDAQKTKVLEAFGGEEQKDDDE